MKVFCLFSNQTRWINQAHGFDVTIKFIWSRQAALRINQRDKLHKNNNASINFAPGDIYNLLLVSEGQEDAKTFFIRYTIIMFVRR